jgi:hypothetical protein
MDDCINPQKILYQFSQKDCVKSTTQPFIHGGKTFSYGSLFLPTQNQEINSEEIHQYLTIEEYALILRPSKQDSPVSI